MFMPSGLHPGCERYGVRPTDKARSITRKNYKGAFCSSKYGGWGSFEAENLISPRCRMEIFFWMKLRRGCGG